MTDRLHVMCVYRRGMKKRKFYFTSLSAANTFKMMAMRLPNVDNVKYHGTRETLSSYEAFEALENEQYTNTPAYAAPQTR